MDDVELAEQVAQADGDSYLVCTARGRGHLYVVEDEASASRVAKFQYRGRLVKIELMATGTQVAAPPSPGYSIWRQRPVLRVPSVARAFSDLCEWLDLDALPIDAGYPPPWQKWVPVGELKRRSIRGGMPTGRGAHAV